MSDITIYHNPKCGTSRNVLQALRDAGVAPTVVEYLKTPPDQATLTRLINDMGVPVREVMRSKEAIYTELGLDDATLSEAQLIAQMAAHPILINRPIVITPKGTLLVRPKERLAEVFP
jgi:arsenate reductase